MSVSSVYAELREEVSCYLDDLADVARFLSTPIDELDGHTPEQYVAFKGERGLLQVQALLPALMPKVPESDLAPLSETSQA